MGRRWGLGKPLLGDQEVRLWGGDRRCDPIP